MSVYIKPVSVIKVRLGIQNKGPVHAFLTNTCYRYMTSFVPGGTKSHLNQNVNLDIDSITYKNPDSHYLFNGKLYVDPKYRKGAFYSPNYGYWSRPGITKVNSGKNLNYHTPGTGAHWDKLMLTSKGDKVVQEVQNFVNGGHK